MFDEVTKREGGKRVATRSAWLAGSTAVQTALVVAVIAVSTAVAKQVTDTPVVDVKFVKPPAPPKPPAAPPAPPRKTPPKPKPVEAPKRPPPMAMVQPKEMPQELKPPDPNEPPEPEYEGSDSDEGGVVGGVVGGVTGGEPAPQAPEPPKAPPPVAFDSTMNPPPPSSRKGPPLEYTQKALEREVEGTMLVRCIVDVDGSVRDCRVLKSVPFMDRAVVEVLERSKYQPATRRADGKPVAVEYTFTIQLRMPR